jgi:protein-S-isoprenylcysteine O-methyltransferase Ste14
MESAVSDIIAHIGIPLFCPLPFVFWPVPLGLGFWLIFLWARVKEQKIRLRERRPNEAAVDSDKGSWVLINYGWRLIRLAALVLALTTPPWGHGAARSLLYCFGLVFMVSGALLRQHCFKMLGNYFTYTVRVSERNEIVKTGIYRWVRHPSYTGGMLYNLGIGLALTNWQSTILIIVGMIVIYVYRVRVEEKALLKVHKTDYSQYMLQTKRFVPFVF